MGLLDMMSDPQFRLGLGLLAAGSPTIRPMGFGERLFQAMEGTRESLAADEDRKLRRALIEAQTQNFASEADARKEIARLKAEELARQRAQDQFLQNMVAPVTGGQASSLPGGPSPENAQFVGKRRPISGADYQAAVALGVPAERVKAIAEAPNFGRQEVAGVRSVMGQNGPQEVPYSKYGDTMPSLGAKAPDAPWYVNYQGGRPQIDPAYTNFELTKAGAGATRVLNNIQAYAPFGEKLQGQMADALVKQYETLQTAPSMLQSIQKAKDLANSNIFTGSLGEQKLAIAKFFKDNLGIAIDPTKINNTEELRSALFQPVMESLRKMDAQPSQMQQKMMMDAFGNLTMDKNSLPRALDIIEQSLRTKVGEHNRRVQEARKTGMPFAYDITIPLDVQQSSTGNVIDFTKLTPR